jgi:uncharacterized protein (DUF1800 family)
MSIASAPSSLLATRRKLAASLSAAIGLDVTATSASLRRPGKASIDERLVNPQNATQEIFATPPDWIRWLHKATFGYSTESGAALQALAGNTFSEKWNTWINQQLDPSSIDDSVCTNRINAAGYSTLGKSLSQLWNDHVRNPATYHVRMRPAYETECATIVRAIYSKRQVYERMVNFWHDHFSVFGYDYDIAPILVHYDRDVIRPNAFGNFRTMLEAVAKSTAMQLYLDNYSSRGADFNENYARELIELHTLGVSNYFGPGDPFEVPCLQTNIHCPGTVPAGYVDNDVYEAAAALTGWTIKNGYWQYPNDNDGTFIYRADWHDRRNKIFMGMYIPANNQPAMQDARAVFDRLVAHPGTAKHIATKLCKRFVGDTPSTALIDAVTQDFANNIQAPDQIAKMLRTVLSSEDFKSQWGTGMKRPFEITMGGLRGLGANFTPQPDSNDSVWTLTERFASMMQLTGHRSFSWGPPNGYPDRQSAWASTGALAMTLKMLAWLPEMRVNNDGSSAFISDVLAQTLSNFPTTSTRTASAIMGYWCDRIFGYRPEPVFGVVTNFLQQNAGANEVIDITVNNWNANNLKAHYTQERLRTAVGMILMSADYFRR